jgi:hypothetical protein
MLPSACSTSAPRRRPSWQRPPPRNLSDV